MSTNNKMISAIDKFRNATLTVLVIICAKIVQWTFDYLEILADFVEFLSIIPQQNVNVLWWYELSVLFSHSKLK